MRALLLGILLALGVAGPASASTSGQIAVVFNAGPHFDFYADAAGSDLNNCAARGAACKTVARVASVVGTKAAKSIGLRAGSAFPNDVLSISAENTKVGVYGGSSPLVIDAAAPISAGAWTKTAGQTVTYQAPITVTCTSSGIVFTTVWENYTPTSATATFVNETSAAAVDAQAGSMLFADNQTPNSGGSGTLFIHTTDGSNPATNGRTYEYSNQCTAINLQGTTGNETVIGPIEGRRSAHGNGPIQVQAPSGGLVTLNGVTARMGTRHNTIVTAPFVVTNSVFADNNPTIANEGTPGLFVVNQSVGSGQNGTLTNNQYLSTLPITSAGASLSHTSSGSYATFTASGEVLSASAGALTSGMAFANVTSLVVNNITCTNVITCINPLTNTTITGGTMKAGTAKSSQVTLGANSITVTISGLTACADTVGDNRGVVSNVGQTGTTISIGGNSKLYLGANPNSNAQAVVAIAQTGNTLTVNNSLLALNGTFDAVYRLLVAVGSGTTYGASNNNTFADGNYSGAFYNGGNTAFAAWKTATSQDASSTETANAACPL